MILVIAVAVVVAWRVAFIYTRVLYTFITLFSCRKQSQIQITIAARKRN